MFYPTNNGQRYHIQATRLPGGERVEEWWVVDGRLTDQPVADALELPGRFMLPGLVDAHTHLSMDFNQTHLPVGSDQLIAANLAIQLQSGVTLVRDAGRLPNVRLDQPQLRSFQPAPRVIGAGRMLAPAGRFHDGLYNPVAPAELIATALHEVAQGIQWVKIIADFPGPDWNWFNPIVNYAPELVRKLVKEVHAAGARVMAHVSGPMLAELIRADVDSIEHGTLLTAELVRELADHGASWTPTFSTMTHHLDPMVARPDAIGAFVRQVYRQWETALPLAEKLGVPILAGTDEMGHGALNQEIAQLQRFGLTADAALAAATTTPRHFFELPAWQVDACADFITYQDDPRHNLQVLNRPAAVVSNIG
jgi:imidazolonepropionase-like amidohydrolase